LISVHVLSKIIHRNPPWKSNFDPIEPFQAVSIEILFETDSNQFEKAEGGPTEKDILAVCFSGLSLRLDKNYKVIDVSWFSANMTSLRLSSDVDYAKLEIIQTEEITRLREKIRQLDKDKTLLRERVHEYYEDLKRKEQKIKELQEEIIAFRPKYQWISDKFLVVYDEKENYHFSLEITDEMKEKIDEIEEHIRYFDKDFRLCFLDFEDSEGASYMIQPEIVEYLRTELPKRIEKVKAESFQRWKKKDIETIIKQRKIELKITESMRKTWHAFTNLGAHRVKSQEIERKANYSRTTILTNMNHFKDVGLVICEYDDLWSFKSHQP